MSRKSEIDRIKGTLRSKKYLYLGAKPKTEDLPITDDWEAEYDWETMRKIMYSESAKVYYMDDI